MLRPKLQAIGKSRNLGLTTILLALLSIKVSRYFDVLSKLQAVDKTKYTRSNDPQSNAQKKLTSQI